jgi:hypothetical protein
VTCKHAPIVSIMSVAFRLSLSESGLIGLFVA